MCEGFGRAFHESHYAGKTLGQLGGVKRHRRCLRRVQRFDMHFRGNLTGAVKEGLPHQHHGAVRRDRQPVFTLFGRADDDLETSIRFQHEIGGIDLPGGGHGAIHRIAIGLGGDAEHRHRIALAPDTIAPRPADGCVHVDIVRVVGADFCGGVRGRVEMRKIRIGIFHMHLQRDPQQPGEVAIPFRLIDRRLGKWGVHHELAERLELRAELVPVFAKLRIVAHAGPMAPCSGRRSHPGMRR